MIYDIPLINKHFSDINPLVFGWENCDPGHFFGPASREYYLFHFIESGRGTFTRNNITYELSKDQIFLIRPYEMTFYKADEIYPWEYIWMGFDGNIVESMLNTTKLSNGNAVLTVPFLRDIFLSLKNICIKHNTIEIYLCSKIHEMFGLLMDKVNSTPTSNSMKHIYIQKAEDYIKSNYARNINIQSISDMLGIDRRYFCRIFAEQIGQTPQKYLVDYRLEKAASLLRHRNYGVGEAARSTGYQDIYNFSKMFKSRYGLSPANYKKKFITTKT